jgi:tetratricopeptide (TPR) repeat protein
MVDPADARARREAAMRQEGGGSPPTEVVRRDVLMPAMASISTRIRAYEEKLKEWQEVKRKTGTMALPQEKLNRINECESQLQDILLEYNSLYKQLQQETKVDAAQLLAGNSLLQLNQEDIGYLESGCGDFLAELKATPEPAAIAVADPQIKAAFDNGDYDQVINLYAQQALKPGQNFAVETTFQYGQALVKNHQEAEAHRVITDLLAKVRGAQGQDALMLPMLQLKADLDFVLESYDEARRSYEEVVRVSIEKGAHKEEWAGVQLAALQPGGAAPPELKEYVGLLKNYLAYTPKRDGNGVAERADGFLQTYPASRFNANVQAMRNDARTQAATWASQGSKNLPLEQKPQEAQTAGGPQPTVGAQTGSQAGAAGGAGAVMPQPAVDEKALQEEYDRGVAHLQVKEYDKAIERLKKLQGTSFDGKARPLIEEASKQAAQEGRQKAAELFVRATNSSNPEDKRKLLVSSRDILQGILTKYPQSGLTDKVQRNLTRIEAELRTVDAAGAAPRPATSGGAYVPPKTGTGTGATVPTGTSL